MGLVTACAVEADGWTLAVNCAVGAPSLEADFALFPGPNAVDQTEATARVVATVSGPGHGRGPGGAAVPGVRTREVVAHSLRYAPYPDFPGTPVPSGFSGEAFKPNNRPLGEQDLGGGIRQIRLMLHKPVAPGETVSVRFRAGWRTGAASDQVVAATNGSTTPLELPSARWATVPYEAIRGTPAAPANAVQVDLVAAHGLPEGKAGLAAVRIIATDGTRRSVPTWLAIGTSTRYGDSVRLWTGQVSLEVEGEPGTYLGDGLIALHWTLFPWFGPVRHSSGALDPATAAPSALHPGASAPSAGANAEAERPLLLAYDRTGTRYGYTTQANPGGGTNPLGHAPSTYYRYVCVVVDPAGTRTSNVTSRNEAERFAGLGNTPEEARASALALPVADRCANQAVAGSVVRWLSRTLPAANGVAASANAMDGAEIFFVAGTHDWSTATAVSGTSNETWITWQGAAGAVIRGATSGTHNYGGHARLRTRNLEFRMRNVGFPTAAGRYHWFDAGTLIRDDNPATPLSTFGVNPTTGSDMPNWATAMTMDLVSAGFTQLSCATMVARSCVARQSFASPVVIGCAKALPASTQTPLFAPALHGTASPRCREDVHWWFNDLRHVHAATWAFQTPTYTDTDGRLKSVRLNVVGNLFEKSGGADGPAYQQGELNATEFDMRGAIIEHNTFIGDRANHMYNQPGWTTLENALTRYNSYAGCRIANNYYDRIVSKHGEFFTGSLASARGPGAHGYRGHLVQGWQVFFGHLNEGNVDGWRIVLGSLNGATIENRGLRCIVSPVEAVSSVPPGNVAWPRFSAPAGVADGGAGNGDYRPLAGSPLLGRATTAQVDADRAGTLRTGATWTAGAIEAEPMGPPEATLGTGSGRHAHRATTPALGVAFAAAATSARHALASLAAFLGFAPGSGGGTRGMRVTRVPRDLRTARPERD
ncbi:hypothetical protein [Thermaurantiacus tibetensis]|uniref:hypothetical protein n=1 Tax=Thermaurantiacus tibetensis TaxID=2759035 RepID=UPI00188E276C|nr:hypothetical protein [Thermaurantiacus tibetensis]